MEPRGPLFQSLPGLTAYGHARELQFELVEKRARNEIRDTILMLEHEPVITQGRGLQFTGVPRPRHMPKPAFLPNHIQFCETERGGDLTYHGPGQLVVYPIIKLDGSGIGPEKDVAAFLRFLEAWTFRAMEHYLGPHLAIGLGDRSKAQQPGATGVWVGGGPGLAAVAEAAMQPLALRPRKVASMGIAVRKWVTYHGLALNVVNDLSPFQLISPCGFSPEVMTRLCDFERPDLLGSSQSSQGAIGPEWRKRIEESFIQTCLA